MKLSVITINYNNVLGLENTMESIFNQSYKNFEYLIIDGGSTDGSEKLIENHKHNINYFVSERDSGVYDAMNKGISLSTGDYLIFMNSGDTFYDNVVIEKFVNLNYDEDLIYGNALLTYPDGRSMLKIMPNKLNADILMSNTLTHQAVFHKKELFKNRLYNLKYKFIADWVFYTEAVLLDNSSYRYVDFNVCKYDMSGQSSINRSIVEKERLYFYKINNDYFIPHLLKIIDRYKLENKRLQNSILFKSVSKFKKLFKL